MGCFALMLVYCNGFNYSDSSCSVQTNDLELRHLDPERNNKKQLTWLERSILCCFVLSSTQTNDFYHVCNSLSPLSKAYLNEL